MKKFLLLTTILIFTHFCLQSQIVVDGQEIVYAGQLQTVNLGDGRILYLDSEEKPLEGVYRILENRNYRTVTFRKGLMDGPCLYYKGDWLYREEPYVNGVREGLRKDYYSDGSLESTAELKANKVDGMVREYSPDGKVISEKGYKNGVEHGVDRTYNPETGEITKDTEYRDGRPYGRWVVDTYLSYSNGESYEFKKISYHGIPGESREIYHDGSIRSEKPRNEQDQPHGRWYVNYPDGSTMEEEIFVDGVRQSKKTFNRDGSPDTERLYSEGILTSRKEYFPGEGKLRGEYTFTNKEGDGTYKLYYENGKLREDGKLTRTRETYRREYYMNGQLKSILNYHNGKWEMLENYSETGEQLSDVYIYMY